MEPETLETFEKQVIESEEKQQPIFAYIVTITLKIKAIDPLRATIDATNGNGLIIGVHADLMEVTTE